MREYIFRIVWDDHYPPSVLCKEYENQYSRVTSYEVVIKDSSCKSAVNKATAIVTNIINGEVGFTLIPKNNF